MSLHIIFCFTISYNSSSLSLSLSLSFSLSAFSISLMGILQVVLSTYLSVTKDLVLSVRMPTCWSIYKIYIDLSVISISFVPVCVRLIFCSTFPREETTNSPVSVCLPGKSVLRQVLNYNSTGFILGKTLTFFKRVSAFSLFLTHKKH